jgi:hypothetical protein
MPLIKFGLNKKNKKRTDIKYDAIKTFFSRRLLFNCRSVKVKCRKALGVKAAGICTILAHNNASSFVAAMPVTKGKDVQTAITIFR